MKTDVEHVSNYYSLLLGHLEISVFEITRVNCIPYHKEASSSI